MRKQLVSLVVATMVGGLSAVAVSSPARAEPCWGSSWKDAPATQNVAYRNCQGVSTRVKGWVDSPMFPIQWGPCVTIPGNGGSAYLLNNAVTYDTGISPWGTAYC